MLVSNNQSLDPNIAADWLMVPDYVSFKALGCFMTPVWRPVHLGPDVGRIRGLFSLQTDPSDTRSWTTLEPINGAEPVFPETATILCSILPKEGNSIFNSFTTGCLSVQCSDSLLVE